MLNAIRYKVVYDCVGFTLVLVCCYRGSSVPGMIEKDVLDEVLQDMYSNRWTDSSKTVIVPPFFAP